MGVTATVRVNVSGIPRKVRRICTSRRVGQFAAEDARRLMARFVPFRDGPLRASAIVSPGTMSHWERYIDKAQLARDITDFVRMI